MNQPKNPYLILAAAVIVPGAGHVLLGVPQRGLMFLFFTTVLGWVSFRLMPENATFIGHHIGGIFIWGISIIDACRLAQKKT